MNHKLYKPFVTLFAVCFMTTVFAQKFDKKFSESFKTNKDVEVEINASNTDINVTTWNKNEVSVEAFIEIEGVSQEEAEKYFKNWNFEALGNASKVAINANSSNSFFSKNDFVFFNEMDFDFEIPDIDSITMKAFTLPEMDFDFDFNVDLENIMMELENIDKTIEKEGKFDFTWKTDGKKIVIKSKEDWEKFKKSKEFKDFKKDMSKEKRKIKEELSRSKEEMKRAMAEAKKVKINKEEIRRELEKAREELKKIKLEFSNETTVDGKKVKIKKRIEIKVPKNATFDLNTRHCKVKLPSVAASGKVNYGALDVENLNGGKLVINYSPVTIQDLNACSLFLNNVTDAKIASVTNAKLSTNSSDVMIEKLNEHMNISSRFGKVDIKNFHPNFKSFLLNLDQSDAHLFLGETRSKIEYDSNRIKFINNRKGKKLVSNIENMIRVQGSYGKVVVN